MKRLWFSKMARIPLYVFVVIICLFAALPFLWLFISALKTTGELFTAPFALPERPQWMNFVQAWNSGIARYLINSVLVTAISVVAIILVSGMAAYAMARLRFSGRIGFYIVLITGYAIPIHTVLVPLYELLRSLSLLNTYAGLVLPYIVFGIPFSVMLLYSFFLEFPNELEDAAWIDGCNTWQILRHIALPLSLPALSSVAIFQGVFIWNEYLLALVIISNNELKTLPLGLDTFRGQYASSWPIMLAAVGLATIPLLILYIVLQRQFTDSLTGFSK